MQIIHRLHDYRDPRSLASRFRAARARHVFTLIETAYAAHGRCRIIDLGGARDYWRAFGLERLRACRASVVIANLEGEQEPAEDVFTFIAGDACATGLEDNAFDLCHSNSVIEHVGAFGRMQRFAAETRRLAPCYYVQTPNFWFPVEPHYSSAFFHWMPRPAQVRSLMRRAHGFHPRAQDLEEAVQVIEGAMLLDAPALSFLFPDARILRETFCGLTKSIMAVRRRP